MSEWIMPLFERGKSGASGVNVVWRSGACYVMDNHRVAAWCWQRHVNENEAWGLLHIDRHFDAMPPRNDLLDSSVAALRNGTELSSYLEASFRDAGHDIEYVRWDNYIPIFHAAHPGLLRECVYATYNIDTPPRLEGTKRSDLSAFELPKWIVNVDLDYVTMVTLERSGEEQWMADPYVRRIGRGLAQGLRRGWIGVLTVALSPETTGSWRSAERLANVLLKRIRSIAWPGLPAPTDRS